MNVDEKKSQTILSSKNKPLLSSPPGGVLMWLIVFMEVVVFAAGFVAVALLRTRNALLFQQEQTHLHLTSGLIMTMCLLVSGWLVAEAVHHYFAANIKKAESFHIVSIFFGFFFLVYKFIDFKDKANAGLALGVNDFWDLYWLLSGFHYLHVLIGMFLLSIVTFKLRKKRKFEDVDFSIRGSGLFWHMCDLAWFFLFPLFYVKV